MKRPTAGPLILFDLVWCGLFTVVVGVPVAGVVWLASFVGQWIPVWVNAALVPAYGILFLFAMCAVAAVVRLLLPRLEPGTFKMPKHPRARAWLLHFALQRVLYLPLWRPLIFSIATLRTAALRALGAKVPLAIMTASDPQILDPGLVTIGPGATIGAGAMTTCHFMLANRIRLAEVHIGADAQLQESAKVALGTTIGDGAIIGLESLLGPDCIIGAGARIGPGCRLLGKVEVGERAKLEGFVVVERDVIIGARAVIAMGTYVPAGTVVPERGRYPVEAPTTTEPLDDAQVASGA